MVKCPNCGQKTSGDYCQWCNYPILKGSRRSRGMTREAEERAKKDAEREAKERAKQDALAAKEKTKQDAIDARKAGEKVKIYIGDINLVVQFPGSFAQLYHFEQNLREIDNLKIRAIGGSADVKGTIISISVQKQIDLMAVLNEIPVVEQVRTTGKDIIVTLKPPTIS